MRKHVFLSDRNFETKLLIPKWLAAYFSTVQNISKSILKTPSSLDIFVVVDQIGFMDHARCPYCVGRLSSPFLGLWKLIDYIHNVILPYVL